MQKDRNQYKSFSLRLLTISAMGILSGCIVILVGGVSLILFLTYQDTKYKGRIYPNVFVDSVNVSGKKPEDVIALWDNQNLPYKQRSFELHLQSTIATISGEELNAGYDSKLIAEQAFLVGRSGNLLTDIYKKVFPDKTVISPSFRWNDDIVQSTLDQLAITIDEPATDALFSFENGKVTEFKPAKSGKKLNKQKALKEIEETLRTNPTQEKSVYSILLSIEPVEPKIATNKTNTYGIKEKIGSGYSEFSGSIPGRIHNVALAASKFQGVLIPPNGIISYNDIVGDISQATGFQQAYIIKDGRTILGDGGGVCQVSSTLFRTALNAGLPIIERTAHAYRVHYYEDGGFKPGLDATVYAPSVDLKILNDTPAYILIQSKTDTKNLTMQIDFYGTSDGRRAEIINHTVTNPIPPPEPLYQDDPTLAKGVLKQVDWSAWGAKAVFTYHVVKGNEEHINKQFVSNYRPWQAVYLRGTKE